MRKTKTAIFSCTPSFLESLDKFSEENDYSRSFVIREAVKSYISIRQQIDIQEGR